MPSDHKMSRWLYVLTFLFASRAPLPCAGFVLRPSCSRTTSTAATVMASPQNFEVTPDLAKKTAALAQIQISDEEVDVLVPRMEEFLGFVETMEEVSQSSDGAFATLNCGSDFLREDYAEKFSNVAAVMDNMPVEENNYLRVPKVGEDEG